MHTLYTHAYCIPSPLRPGFDALDRMQGYGGKGDLLIVMEQEEHDVYSKCHAGGPVFDVTFTGKGRDIKCVNSLC